MNTDRELLQQALDALKELVEIVVDDLGYDEIYDETIAALRARLAQPEPEPVAWMWDVYNGAGYSSRGIGFQQTNIPFAKHTPLYTAPPQREWQGLTDEEIAMLVREAAHGSAINRDGGTSNRIARAIEAKLKEKNT